MNSDGIVDLVTRGSLTVIATIAATVAIWQIHHARTTLVRLVNTVALIPSIAWGWFYLCSFRNESLFLGTLPTTVWISRIVVLLTLAAVLLIQLVVKESESSS